MKNTFYTLSVMLLMLISCQQEAVTSGNIPTDEAGIEHYVPGKATVRVSEDLAQSIESDPSETCLIAGARVKRTFPHGGKYEERMRRSGLHLWYDVKFDESLPLTKAGETLQSVEGIELIEYIPVIRRTAATDIFNDPSLKKQWHYFNQGNPVTKLIAGCDINVIPAWERGIVGSENVIVAVLDGGIDITHEDLKDNLWEGTDPEGNVIHGYNFVAGSYKIKPDDHGTHVAGTIAAVNNNETGVCGIAGGDAAKGIKGVRLMSCAILDGDKGGDEAAAMVWAANNGAVIAQNSWGYTLELNPDMKETPEYIKKAIDYFNTYAGCDENGDQLPDSPMKGGVVLFAAGNESKTVGYPASYEGCIAVSATAGDYKLASYSNYGDWIDIAAPGGDAMKNHLVLSTVSANSYQGYQGTSMACPHVSGVAALVLSEFGGPGFTREDLIDRLLTTATETPMPAHHAGAGLVNASAAVARYGEDLPFSPQLAGSEEISGTSLLLKYIMPNDNKGVRNSRIELFRSTSPFDNAGDLKPADSISVQGMHPGDTISFTVENLDFNTTYYFSVQGYDVYGNASPLSENEVMTTRDNLAPVIEALDGTVFSFKKYMSQSVRFKITDPEDKLKEVTYINATDGESFTQEKDLYVLKINAQEIQAGEYSSKITASDVEGKTSECLIEFTIEENRAPSLQTAIGNLVFSSTSGKRTINLNDHITDPDGEALAYTAVSSSETVAKVSLSRDVLTLNSASLGESVITVTASDASGLSVSTSFKVIVRDGNKPFDLYPDPATDFINIRTGKEQEYTVHIYNATGKVMFCQTSSISTENALQIDITSFGPGYYTARLDGADGKTSETRFVKL